MNKTKLFLLSFLTIQIVSSQNKKQKDSIVSLDEVILSADVIFGSKFSARNRTGSAYFISAEEIQKFGYTDVGRVLGNIPGVNVVEEDGFGLRPNISLRGTSPERSAKITVMEDGVLIAPAPYSAPAAYYFPTIGRMESVEILKGSSQVQFGPYTTGGAINLLSTSVPEQFKANLNTRYGTFNTSRLQAMVGDSKKHFGYMIEFLNYNSDGFKNLDNEEDTGFIKNDIVAKFRVNTAKAEGANHAVELKFQYSDEDSDETYLGLTDGDFTNTPFRRYAGSQEDEMITEHIQLAANHKIDFSKQFRITTTGYLNNFSRNWYKLNDVGFEGSKVKINDLLESPIDFPNEFAIVNGSQNAAADALYVKANNREYASRGVQTKLDYHFYGENTFHDIEVGLRYHYDEEDRFQWVDLYGITDGVTNLTTAGTPGTDANRISSATAFASFAMYKFKYKDLTLTPGVRYENITLVREDYGGNDVNRTGVDLSERENKVNIFIPGMGFNYNLDSKVSLFGGIHKGFAPPGSQDGEQPEESVNYELGSRFSLFGISGEVVGFYNDYSNLLGSDTASSGGTGSLDQFNAGEVTVSGLELLLNYNPLQEKESLNLPITFGYTYTNAEFESSFGSEEDLWGEVTIGDQLPYIAKHQFSTSLGLEHKKFQLNVSGRFNGAFRTEAGQGAIPENEKVASNFVLDFAGKYHLNKYLSLTANVINLLDETYAVSRVPAGLRPGHPFGVYAGLQLRY